MDMVLDFSDDKIQSFLSTKLEEIRLNNEALETVLNEHKRALRCTFEDSLMNEISFKVVEGESWKAMFNNKYAIGHIILTCSKEDLKNIKVFLTWDSDETLCYKVEIFGILPLNKKCNNSKNCNLVTDTVEKQSSVFQTKAYIIVIFDVPQYLNKLEYEVSGNFICNVEGKDYNIPLPKVNVSAIDCITNYYEITQNPLRNVFTMMSCLNQTDLVMILPEEWSVSLLSTFEIHCAFKNLNLMISCKTYFVSNSVSKLFDNTLIVVHPHHKNKNILFLKIFAASNNQMYALCHHLGSCLPNCILFPCSYYESYLCKNAFFSKELLEEFGRSMRQELELSYEFTQGSSNDNSSQQFNQFRSKLSTIESNTDNSFLKVSNMKH